MKPLTTDSQGIASFRQSVYQMFSECFLAPPTAERLPYFLDPEWRARATSLLGPGVEELHADLTQAPEPDDLAVEHAALFVVPGPRQTLPFETVYRERDRLNGNAGPGRMLGHTALQVQRAYVRWGFAADLDTDEFPDHAGVELRFMSLLAATEKVLRESFDGLFTASVVQAEADFLRNHILQWFPQWLEHVRERAQRPFYSAAAAVLGKFLEKEERALDRLVAASLVWAD